MSDKGRRVRDLYTSAAEMHHRQLVDHSETHVQVHAQGLMGTPLARAVLRQRQKSLLVKRTCKPLLSELDQT